MPNLLNTPRACRRPRLTTTSTRLARGPIVWNLPGKRFPHVGRRPQHPHKRDRPIKITCEIATRLASNIQPGLVLVSPCQAAWHPIFVTVLPASSLIDETQNTSLGHLPPALQRVSGWSRPNRPRHATRRLADDPETAPLAAASPGARVGKGRAIAVLIVIAPMLPTAQYNPHRGPVLCQPVPHMKSLVGTIFLGAYFRTVEASGSCSGAFPPVKCVFATSGPPE